MGNPECWYDPFYSIGMTFPEDVLKNMSETELNNLLKLAAKISDKLY